MYVSTTHFAGQTERGQPDSDRAGRRKGGHGPAVLARGRLLGALVLVSSHPHVVTVRRIFVWPGAHTRRPWRRKRSALIQARDEVSRSLPTIWRNPIHAGQFAAPCFAAASRRGRRESPQERRDHRSVFGAGHPLIQDLLDVARIEAGHLSIEQDRVPPNRWSSRPRKSQQILASASSVSSGSMCRLRSRCLGRPDRLLQVFRDHFIGTREVTAPGGRITLGAARKEKVVLFGWRIPARACDAESLPHLVERIYQARKTDRRRCGAGAPHRQGHRRGARRRIWRRPPSAVVARLFHHPGRYGHRGSSERNDSRRQSVASSSSLK